MDEGGSPHETDTLRGGGTPAEAGDGYPERADKGGEYTRQGEGGVWELRNITHFDAASPTPEGINCQVD